MLEMLGARVKVTLLLALFLTPVFIAVWDKQLDAWLKQNHRYEPLMDVHSIVTDDLQQ